MLFALLSLILPLATYASTNMESVPRPNIRRVPLDVENYPVAPAELELEQVHIYIRHGERTPVGLRLTPPAAGLPQHWLMCTTGRKMRAAAFTEDPRSALQNVQREVERKDGSTVEGEWYTSSLLSGLRKAGQVCVYSLKFVRS